MTPPDDASRVSGPPGSRLEALERRIVEFMRRWGILEPLGLWAAAPLVLLRDVTFQAGHLPHAPTMEGQYIIKNLLIISAALVVGGTVRGMERAAGRVGPEQWRSS